MTNIPPPAPPPVWDHIRLRYEQAQETVAQIAASIGISGITLSRKAKAEGWLMRSLKSGKAAKPKPPSTRDTLRRLKDILQSRLGQLEGQITEIGAEINALANERDIRATNTLVRTLEKVLELEHKERKQRSRRARETRKFNDAEREELARRIDALCQRQEEPDGGVGPGVEDRQESSSGMAPVGEAGPASP
jgi:chromosome segregation ATPase